MLAQRGRSGRRQAVGRPLGEVFKRVPQMAPIKRKDWLYGEIYFGNDQRERE